MSLFCVALVLVAAPPAEFTSGPQGGASIPGPFEPLNLNGPDAGDECCLYCKYGNLPVVMVFAPKPGEGLAKLVRAIEAVSAGEIGKGGVCVIVTDTTPATRRALGKLADDANLKHVVLAVIDPEKLKAFELNPDAEATVLLYSKKVVRQNFAFRAGGLTDAAIGAVADAAKKHLAGR